MVSLTKNRGRIVDFLDGLCIASGCGMLSGTVVFQSLENVAGAPGIEPGIAGSKPDALPLGYAPASVERHLCKCGTKFKLLSVQKW